MSSRDIRLDIAKGLAIFSVVLAHLDTGLKGQIIYLFHMPFFFIVSGYLHHTDVREGRYFKKKCISLLVPYCVYLLVFKAPSIFSSVLAAITNPSGEAVVSVLGYLAWLAHGGDELTGEVGIFWFVTCLFLTQQLFNFVSIRISSTKTLLSIALASYVLSVFDQISPVHLGFPWAANVVACAFFFYAIGFIYGKYLFENHSRLLIFAASAISVFSIVLLNSGLQLSFEMKEAYYGFFVLSPLAAFSLTKLLSLCSSWIARIGLLAVGLSFLGKAAITVMFVHRTVEYSLPDFLNRGSIFTACAITAICCVAHLIFTRIGLLRALLLGSREDIRHLLSASELDS